MNTTITRLLTTALLLAAATGCSKKTQDDLEKQAQIIGAKAIDEAKDKATDLIDDVIKDHTSSQQTAPHPNAPAAAPEGSGHVIAMSTRPSLPTAWNQVKFSGGDGTSCASSVVLEGAPDQMVGTQAEYNWLSQVYPGYEAKRQSTTDCSGKRTHIQEVRTADGKTVQVYFDISAFPTL